MEELKERYFEILTHGGNLTELCNLTAEYTNTPVAITLPTRTIIRKSANYTKELIEEYVSAFTCMEEEDTIEHVKEMNQFLMTGKPFSRMWIGSRYKRIDCGCFQEGKLVAVLDCPIVNGKASENAFEILQMVTDVFVTALRLNNYLSTDTRHPLQSYLSALLRGESIDAYQMKNVYNSYLKNNQSWRILWMLPRTPYIKKDMRENIKAFCSLNGGFLQIEYQDGYAVLLDEMGIRNIGYFVENSKKISYMCISEEFSDLRQAKKMLDMAVNALKIAKVEENADGLVRVEKYKTVIIYMAGYKKPPESVKEYSLIDQMQEYDKRHQSEYCETIRAWLFNEGDVFKIADKLKIHKNTVSYRLKKISEVFGINLKDCHVVTELYLTIVRELVDFDM